VDERFDELSREMAGPVPRRGVLKMLGAAVSAAAVATVLKPFRGDAIPACPSGQVFCGQTCCPGTTCPQTGCCCDPGQTPCGPACCAKGVACQNQATGFCGCPPGTTPCGSGSNLTCCPPGAACSSGCPTPKSFGVKSTVKVCCAGLNQPCSTQVCCPGLTCLSQEGVLACQTV
jgi:hypothetical protein